MMRTAPRKDRSRPFPCQDRPCGCSSADECWHHCCCMSNKQKVAWARQHGVTPPDFVIAAAAKEDDSDVQVCQGDCCQSAAGHPENEPPCCRGRHRPEPSATGSAYDDDGKTQSKVTLVLTSFARQCRGLPPIVFLLTDAVPTIVAPQWKPADTLAGYVIEAPGNFTSAELSPPVPPPKLSCGIAA
jgi:hypothetical protein